MPKANNATTAAASTAAVSAILSLTGLTFAEFAPLAKALEAQAKRRSRVREELSGRVVCVCVGCSSPEGARPYLHAHIYQHPRAHTQ